MFPTSLFNLVLMSKNGQLVQYDDFLVKTASKPHVDPTPEPPVDPYNPLGLPPFTIRCKFDPIYTPTMGDSQTLVDASENIWDITKNSNDWSKLFQGKYAECLLGVIGANTTNVIYMSRMFAGCTRLSTVPLFDTKFVTEMSAMFSNCTSLSTVPLFDTSSVTDISGMLYGCTSLRTVPLFDTSSVINMSGMLHGCTSLSTVPLFDTKLVTNISSMFNGCTSLSTVPLFNTSSVTAMFDMFAGCTSLSTVPLFDTSSVTNMSEMFIGCTSLSTVPLFDTSSVTRMEEMFMNCKNVQSGALALYQQASTQAIPPSVHEDAFLNCGSSTETGAAELTQIPTSWGGRKAE